MDGQVDFVRRDKLFKLKRNDFITVKPFEIHSISVIRNYSMLALNINKKYINTDTISENLPKYISKRQYYRRFKASKGLSPYQYELQNKVRTAQSLLLTSKNISKIAQDADFYDHSHFIRHFKSYLGLTPSEYIKSCIIL